MAAVSPWQDRATAQVHKERKQTGMPNHPASSCPRMQDSSVRPPPLRTFLSLEESASLQKELALGRSGRSSACMAVARGALLRPAHWPPQAANLTAPFSSEGFQMRPKNPEEALAGLDV